MEPPPAKVEDLKSRANALAAKGTLAPRQLISPPLTTEQAT